MLYLKLIAVLTNVGFVCARLLLRGDGVPRGGPAGLHGGHGRLRLYDEARAGDDMRGGRLSAQLAARTGVLGEHQSLQVSSCFLSFLLLFSSSLLLFSSLLSSKATALAATVQPRVLLR